ncbi:hypothetical protein HYPSUDRAFT_941500 [Hypholoma sublateritium FD-334 SS-4]|uniref:Uncharacterized protein n=1 Tax=Hypholoma sublateritium (strain FD-334 SS-4) TaxID=945553 RepID=A0A0D2PG02_HYPSF|nr:hypothetical protein HYPSUDRAFT_941500 [Hypholoma sublateritium FD-334 SS-4]
MGRRDAAYRCVGLGIMGRELHALGDCGAARAQKADSARSGAWARGAQRPINACQREIVPRRATHAVRRVRDASQLASAPEQAKWVYARISSWCRRGVCVRVGHEKLNWGSRDTSTGKRHLLLCAPKAKNAERRTQWHIPQGGSRPGLTRRATSPWRAARMHGNAVHACMRRVCPYAAACMHARTHACLAATARRTRTYIGTPGRVAWGGPGQVGTRAFVSVWHSADQAQPSPFIAARRDWAGRGGALRRAAD